MPKLHVTVPHALGAEEAKSRIQGAIADAKTRYADRVSDLQERWDGDQGEFSGRAMGFNVSGNLAVRADAVEITGDLPFAATMFKGQIETMIRDRATKILS